ncbi:MAG TPA: hypothetical protein VKX25_08700 [Bryobacteraceae bacterium]|jgi:hypothetical protein|nr:hypothetical protein [Bryobacteraceae bacterium]
MAVTARNFRSLAVAALFCVLTTGARADQAGDLRERVMQVSNAISAANGPDAMEVFSKSCKDYDKLRRDFTGLADGYQITNEVNFLDDPSEGDEPEMHVHWTMTLGDAQHTFSIQRAADITVRFRREKGKWKIVEFAPIDIFDPSAQIPAR